MVGIEPFMVFEIKFELQHVMFTYIHTHTHTCTHARTHAHTHTRTHTYTHISISISLYIYVCVCNGNNKTLYCLSLIASTLNRLLRSFLNNVLPSYTIYAGKR